MQLKPTESELEILNVLWEFGPSSVRFVNENLSEKRNAEVGYTTTLKLMQIMVDKGLCFRDGKQRIHIYEAALKEKVAQGALLKNMVNTLFRGSATELVMQALGNHKTSQDELDEIKKLIESLEKREA
jgi:predicted transcriptional regulator